MRRRSLRSVLAVRFALLVLTAIAFISLVSNLMIDRQFEDYVEEQQGLEAAHIAQNICDQYNTADGGWNIDYVHGVGMYALERGFILKLHNAQGNILWDAEDHDMTLCHDVMQSIATRMQEERHLDGDFVSHRFDLDRSGSIVGYLDISYYSPYSMNENDFRFISTLNRILAAVGGVFLAGAVMMGILLANSIVTPISKVVEVTQRISGGDYDTSFQERVGTKELYELAHAVDQMARVLSEQEALRKRLTSDVAHELRTPVANVSSYLEMMLDGAMEPTQERLQSCYDELRRLSDLISDLEQLRQVENENLILQKTEIDLRELSQAVMENFGSQLREKALDGQVAGDAVIVSADRGRIQQVLTNLVSNAINYSNDGGIVRITVEDGKDSGILHVEDNGIGIPQEDQQRIFERFYRTDQSRNRKTGGAGIGLAIVKTIVRAHNGEISVESEEGKGSRFTVVLPKQDSL